MKFAVQRRYDGVPLEPPLNDLAQPGRDKPDGQPGASPPGKPHSPDSNGSPILDLPLEEEKQVTISPSSPTSVGGRNDENDGTLEGCDIDLVSLKDALAKRGRSFSQRHQRRLVFKDGECNISLGHITKKKRRFLSDVFTTLMDIKWRYALTMFVLAFLISWLVFALIWWVIVICHGDHLHPLDDPNWEPCMDNVNDFVTALLFSVETQHTIGYGGRAMGVRCPEAIIILMVQSCLGVFIQSLMTGIIFAKLSRPKHRGKTVMFSKNAVICQRDDKYVLLFRITDMRSHSRMVDSIVRAAIVRNRLTKEGESIPLCQEPLIVCAENAVDGVCFTLWPTTVIHTIDSASPLWDMSCEDMLSEHFEIIVFFEGTIESTGMTAQVRTSYLPGEVLWGHRLAPLVAYQKENGQYKVDYMQFHTTIPVENMPERSASDFSEGSGDGPSAATLTVPKLGITHHLSFASQPPQHVPSHVTLSRASRAARHRNIPNSWTLGPTRSSPIPPAQPANPWKRRKTSSLNTKSLQLKNANNGSVPHSMSLMEIVPEVPSRKTSVVETAA